MSKDSSNKERNSTSSALNSPFLDKKDVSGSANKLGEYIRTIKDENENLKIENQRLIDSFKKETNIQNAANADARVNAKVESIKMQLTADFDHCKEELEKFYEAKCNDINKHNENFAIENSKLKKEIEQIRIDNFDKSHTISNLNNQIRNINEFNEKRNRQNENRLTEILIENKSLKSDLESTVTELSAKKAEKEAIENELSEFRSLLDSMGGGSSPKRKRMVRENPINEAKFDIAAFTNDKVKLYCDEQCNGDYIKLMNDTDNPINLNEWKIEIVSDDFKDCYCFPDRIIKGKRVLNVWRKDALSVVDDEDNIRMNVALPDFSKSFSCELTNDMYEFEASFQLKRTCQRKFIKAHSRNV